MKNQIILYLSLGVLIGGLLGFLICAKTESASTVTIPSSYLDADTLSLKGILGLLQNQKDSLIDRTTEAEALSWVNNFQYFNENLKDPLVATMGIPSSVKCPNLNQDPIMNLHSWFISEWDLIRLWAEKQSGFGKGFSGIRIYPAIRNQSYNLNGTVKVLKNAMTLVICPTYENEQFHENQYNGSGGNRVLKTWEYVDPCPKVCPEDKYGPLDLVKMPPSSNTYVENCD